MGDAWNIFSILQFLMWSLGTLAGRGMLCLIVAALIHARGGSNALAAVVGIGCAVFWGLRVYIWGKRSKRW